MTATLLPCSRLVGRKRVVCGGAPEIVELAVFVGSYFGRCTKCGGSVSGGDWTEDGARREWNRVQELESR